MEENKDKGETFEDQEIHAKLNFVAHELGALKERWAVHAHNIAQIVRELQRINGLDLQGQINGLEEKIDDLKIRMNEIQAKSHRKFAGGGENKTEVEVCTPGTPRFEGVHDHVPENEEE